MKVQIDMRSFWCAAGVSAAALIGGPAVAQAPAPAPAAPQAAASRPAAAPTFQIREGVVATVNDQLISSFDLRQRMLMLIVDSQIQPTEENLPSIQQAAIRQLVEERLQAQEIARFPDLVVGEPDIDARLAEIAASSSMTLEAYMRARTERGVHPRSIREQVRTNIGWIRLVGGRFGGRARVGEEQITATIAQLAAAAAKTQYRVAEIYIDAAQAGGQQQALNSANQLVQEMLRGAPFDRVARQFSNSPTARGGGDMGWLVDGEIRPELQRVLSQMQPGALARPIPVEGGVYVIYLIDKRTGGVSTVASLKHVAVRLAENAPQA
ncbi:MAG TPA: peptidylprolyl isomerase, partial [Caulobacteraceae bacterium]